MSHVSGFFFTILNHMNVISDEDNMGSRIIEVIKQGTILYEIKCKISIARNRYMSLQKTVVWQPLIWD